MKLKDYISGKREGKDANRLEQDALNNPFLHDALDGYDAFDENHLPMLESLEKALDKRISKGKNQHTINRKMVWIAASIVLLIGIGSFFIVWNSGSDKDFVASNSHLVKKDSSTVNEEERLPVIVDDEDDSLQTEIPVEVPPKPLIADYKPVRGEEQSEERESYFDGEQQTGTADDDPALMSEIHGDVKLDSLVPDSGFNGFMADASKGKKDEGLLSITKRTGQVPDKSGKLMTGILVEGTALDEFGEPMIGASVYVEGTSIATITDLDGHFKLSVPSDLSHYNLITSYIGYEPQKFTLPADNELAYVHLKPSANALDEVVVVGYGIQKKSSVTGSVSQVEGKKIEFGEKQFKTYLAENINTDLCEEKAVKVSVKFYLDDTGKPTNIQVKLKDCEALEDEIVYLLENGPKWSQRNKDIKFRLKVKFQP
ncbi:MAG: carboxypeptidase-like regulatory domain-containing protein [Tannerella sp.]|jgi:hypothetical protein|nr:carboxypeptidase-like regulatory domain-containing protein [Tannerella sp.]